ncbi:hypothetical protein B0O80DRAFT_448896 [Mortierella sp. GBAus27b]|nr:hypothetical protein B0O80DRAFT_448896 [Mortierella sp. GBAus27b]
MRSSFLTRTAWTRLLLVVLVALSCANNLISAQSTNCHSCLRKAIPAISKCSSLTVAQQETLNEVIIGKPLFDSVGTYKTQDPPGFTCLGAMMWDVIEYKGKLWGSCLDPANSCNWSEMMQWLSMITRIAAVYGTPNPPAQVLRNAPA